jgi:lysophospholipid acyltransferase (LPLAT)-like uncharacterized protein
MTDHLLKRLLKDTGRVLLPVISAGLLWLICATIRKSIEDGKWELQARESESGIIVTAWHGRLLYFAFRYRGKGASALISHSRDGELIARLARLFGFRIVRGSKSKGGMAASRELYRRLKRGENVAIAPDGPRGPGRHAHQGVISLAGFTGCPIYPVSVGFKRKKVFGGWDNMVLPYPFTAARIVFGEPVYVPHRAGEDLIEAKRMELENVLNRITVCADAHFK